MLRSRAWGAPTAPNGQGRANVAIPRLAMGHILGNAVRLSPCDTILALCEGNETMLSLTEAVPGLPVWAALSSGHLESVAYPRPQLLYASCASLRFTVVIRTNTATNMAVMTKITVGAGALSKKKLR